MNTKMSELQQKQCVNILHHALLRAIENDENDTEALDNIVIMWEQMMQNFGVGWKDIENVYNKVYEKTNHVEIKSVIYSQLCQI
jgi:hypothetical protein